MSEETPDQPDPRPADPATGPQIGRVRRAPRYGSFVVTGAIVGIVLAVVVSYAWSSASEFSQNSVVGYVAATLGLIGALLGAVLAVLLDRRDTARGSRREAGSGPDPS